APARGGAGCRAAQGSRRALVPGEGRSGAAQGTWSGSVPGGTCHLGVQGSWPRMVARPASVPVGAPTSDRMRRLAKAALVVLTGFLLSRLLGLVRNIVIAAHFGTGTDYAAYVSA